MTAKKVGGGKLARSETVTVRLDPKLRYLAELASRKQRRTLSSYIEWAIEESLDNIIIKQNGIDTCLADFANELWDVDEADRFILLAHEYPDLLTHEEQIQWKIVQEEEFFRDVNRRIMVSVVRSAWEEIKKYAAGEISYKEFKSGIVPF